MTKNILKIIAIFLVGMVGGIFADQIFWPYFVERPLFYKYGLEQSPVYLTERTEVIIQENTALQTAVEKVERAVVGVKTETAAEEILTGSGLVVTSDGLIVTLATLVPQGSDFSFFVEGKAVAYQILKRDQEYNLALVKLEAGTLQTLGFANIDRLKLAERVFLVGAVGKEKLVNQGIVKTFDEDFIQTNIVEDVSLQGSPLFNIEAEVLGLSLVEGGEVLAIPVSKIRQFIGF